MSELLGSLLSSEDGLESLPYSIHDFSSSSSSYVPENVLSDRPGDQSSRWSSASISPPQYLSLRLSKPSLLKFLLFGKYEKTHVCNLKRFKVYGALKEEDPFIELLDSGLKNDSTPEAFPLRLHLHGRPFPLAFIKIVPIQSWGPIFNFSIWHVALLGLNQEDIVRPAIQWQEEFREVEAIKLCLKHFRQHNYMDIFASLQKRTQIQLESEFLDHLHELLVNKGDFTQAENMIEKAIQDNLFNQWIDSQPPTPEWTPLALPSSEEGEEKSLSSSFALDSLKESQPSLKVTSSSSSTLTPSSQDDGKHPGSGDNEETSQNCLHKQPQPRGGHQMVIDTVQKRIYLFGGWNGQENLNDFWSISVSPGSSSSEEKWNCISLNTELDGGPSPRSCHKMVLDPSSRHIFVLGRYLERELRDNIEKLKGDFFMYNLDTRRWTLITDDTASMGGPGLCFDHQMALNNESRMIFVFGGHCIYPSTYLQGHSEHHQGHSLSSLSGEKRYSGLYSYHIPTNTWKQLREDNNGSPHLPGMGEIRSRSNHSMVFHRGTRKLYIFGGQRKRDDYLNDFFTYDVDSDEIEVLSSGNSSDSSIPDVGHTIRATIDCDRNEIYVMMGLNKVKSLDKASTARGSNSLCLFHESNRVISSFWVYSILRNTWNCLYRNDNSSSCNSNNNNSLSSSNSSSPSCASREPQPRYAHQIVYDESTRTHYMFGGNPGGREGNEEKIRFGDFWSLFFVRPSPGEVLRMARLMIRRVEFLELALDTCNPLAAMSYLQGRLSSVVDHANPKEEREFQLLATCLFKGGGAKRDSTLNGDKGRTPPKYHDVTRDRRSDLFDELSKFFPPDMTQPKGNLVDVITQKLDH